MNFAHLSTALAETASSPTSLLDGSTPASGEQVGAPKLSTKPDGLAISLAIPVFADRYEVRGLLGEGGMGAVFRVFDRELAEEVALKVLHIAWASEPSAVDRFRREVKLARRVTHANVARTYDVGHHDVYKFLTMELVPGQALAAVVRNGERLVLAEILRIADHIARGLSAAHAVGVVHRDLKPENIIRCPGTNGRVVITDFGIARLAEGRETADDLQLTLHQIVGTPAYMAPEQLTGKAIDGRTDVYAFGTLLYEMLTGVLPFGRDSLMASVAARLSEDPPDPRTIEPNIPEPVALLTISALARQRESRPDAEMMLQSLERLRGGGERRHFVPSLTHIVTSSKPTLRVVAVAPVDCTAPLPWSGPDLGAALADGLSSLHGLRVLPPGVMGVMGAKEPRAIATDLGATWLIETSLRGGGEGAQTRARTRLLDLEAGTQLWAATPIDISGSQPFVMEDLLVSTVTEALRERIRDGNAGPINPAVRQIWEQVVALSKGRSVPGAQQAVAILEKALPSYPNDPWLSCALGANLARLYGLMGSTNQAYAARAEEMCLRALAADPTLGEAYYAIGVLRAEQGETRAAVRAFHEALARAPLLADSHVALGSLLVETGHVEEGLRRFDVALRLDPTSLNARVETALAKGLLGDRVAAEFAIRDISQTVAYPMLVRAVFWWSDPILALELADAFEKANTGAPWEAAVPALRAYAEGKFFEESPVVFRRLASVSQAADRNRSRVLQVATEYFAAMGRNELALEWLEEAQSFPFENIFWLDHCGCLDTIRQDPRFAKIRGLVAARAAEVWR